MMNNQRKIARTAVTWLVAAALVAICGAAGNNAFAESTKDRARSHYLKGKSLYDRADYKGAIAEFAAADGLAPSPLLEFNIALCYEKLGDAKEAVRRYRIYLDRDPNADNRSSIESKIKQLQSQLTAEEERARKKAEEEARKAEQARKAEAVPPPPPPDSGGPSGETPGPANPTAPSGDPELDRVNRIDIASIRDQRRGGGGGGERVAAAGTAEGPPDGPPPARRGGVNPPPPNTDGGNGKKKTKPIYKQWWFWVVVGVSAVILIDIASSDSSSNAATRMAFPEGVGAGRDVSAPILLRF